MRWLIFKPSIKRSQEYKTPVYDHLISYGVDCLVTPPNLVPQTYGNRVKTDKRDSRKLAHLLAKGMLKRVWVLPSEEERFHRQVIRRRRQLIRDRVRVQNRIKSEPCFYGVELPSPRGKWSRVYFENLCRIRFKGRWMQGSFNRLLEQYEFLNEQICIQTQLLRELSKTTKCIVYDPPKKLYAIWSTLFLKLLS